MFKKENKNTLTGGFEPPTFRLTAERSTDWATRATNIMYQPIQKYLGLAYERYQMQYIYYFYLLSNIT